MRLTAAVIAHGILSTVSLAQQICPLSLPSSPWSGTRFDSFVTFGDSYTDEGRLEYLIANNGKFPPTGQLMPTSPHYRPWARYVIQYTGETLAGSWRPSMTLYNYAVSGAVCSNDITPRPFPLINLDFPSVLDYEIPAFLADKETSLFTSTSSLSSSRTLYALFIGTNDLGNTAFLTDSQLPGLLLTNYTSCLFTALDRIYASGGRNFLLMNTVPLNLLPQYANDTLQTSQGGSIVDVTRFFPDKPSNHTAISHKMHLLTTSANEIVNYRLPYELVIAKRYPGADIALFDSWSLFHDIYHNPTNYLNGSEPANVAGWLEHCDMDFTNCWRECDGKSDDSFMWVDELHPSEQVHRVLAREVVETLNGKSKYATYWSG